MRVCSWARGLRGAGVPEHAVADVSIVIADRDEPRARALADSLTPGRAVRRDDHVPAPSMH